MSCADVQTLLETVFGCVAYLREFYREDVFERRKMGDLTLQSIVRGRSPQSDALLAWIADGCMDAVRRGYMRTALLTVVGDRRRPQQTVLEAYTVCVEYASGAFSVSVDRSEHGGPSQRVAGQATAMRPGSWHAEAARMMRSLCVMLQTLPALPERKYLAMHVTYDEAVTPADYEPPGFAASVFDAANLFERSEMVLGRKVLRAQFARVALGDHAMSVAVEALDRPGETPDVVPEAKASQTCSAARMHALDGVLRPEAAESAAVPLLCDALGSATPEGAAASPAPIVPCADKMTLSLELSEGRGTQEAASRVPPTRKGCTKGAKMSVDCLCGDKAPDMDMIGCDMCHRWMHTPCAGYCTNRDKRIPETYVCQRCVYRPSAKLVRQLSDLASLRRAISLVYAEGFETIASLARRLDCGVSKAARLVRRLEREGLLARGQNAKNASQASPGTYSVQKTPAAKERIRYFFGLDVTIFPEIAACFSGRHRKPSGSQGPCARSGSLMRAQSVNTTDGHAMGAPGVNTIDGHVMGAQSVNTTNGHTVQSHNMHTTDGHGMAVIAHGQLLWEHGCGAPTAVGVAAPSSQIVFSQTAMHVPHISSVAEPRSCH